MLPQIGLQSPRFPCHAGADMASDAKQSKNPAAVALGRMDRNFIERQLGGGYGGKLKCHNSRTGPFADPFGPFRDPFAFGGPTLS
jgi:hypothetical protein